jgi:hypothetical protein
MTTDTEKFAVYQTCNLLAKNGRQTYLSHELLKSVWSYAQDTYTVIVHQQGNQFGKSTYVCKKGPLTREESSFLHGTVINGNYWLSCDIINVFKSIQTCRATVEKYDTHEKQDKYINQKMRQYLHVHDEQNRKKLSARNWNMHVIRTLLYDKINGKSQWKILKKSQLMKLGRRIKLIKKTINAF